MESVDMATSKKPSLLKSLKRNLLSHTMIPTSNKLITK